MFWYLICTVLFIDIERPKIDCLSFVMCPLLAQLKIGFFSSFFVAAVYSTNEANKGGLKQSIFLDVYGSIVEQKKINENNKKILGLLHRKDKLSQSSISIYIAVAYL